jgi:hypothetical protein
MKLRALLPAALALTASCLLAPYLSSAPDEKKVAAVVQQLRKRAVALAAMGEVKTEFPKNNDLCLLCHANLKKDEIVKAHGGRGILCAHCHGVSFEHMDDETSRTKPDYVFGRGEVAPFCQQCHSDGCEEPAEKAAFLAEWKSKTRSNGRVILKQAMCTDCHGMHAMVGAPMAGGAADENKAREGEGANDEGKKAEDD